MHLEKLTEPGFNSVTLARLRNNSNIPPGQDEDFLIEALKSAEDYVERYLECTIGIAEWRLTLDSFPPANEPLLIPLWPIRNVILIAYLDSQSVRQELDLNQIVPPKGNDRYHLKLKSGFTWPTTLCEPNAVEIDFTAGFATQAKIPGTMTQAIRMLVSHWYENREAVLTGTVSKEIELGVSSMLSMLETEYD